MKLLIRSILRQQKYNFPPLHLPSDKLVLRRGQQLTQLVFNYRAFMRTWTRNANVPCKCKMFQSTTQASSIVEGHVMCAARDIAPTSCLAKANLAAGRHLEVAGSHSFFASLPLSLSFCVCLCVCPCVYLCLFFSLSLSLSRRKDYGIVWVAPKGLRRPCLLAAAVGSFQLHRSAATRPGVC